MKAGVVHAKNDIRYEEIPKPAAEPGKVVVKVKYTGICGSDIPRVNGDACHYFRMFSDMSFRERWRKWEKE